MEMELIKKKLEEREKIYLKSLEEVIEKKKRDLEKLSNYDNPKDLLKDGYFDGYCPNRFGFEENCARYENCTQCWEDAIKEV